MKRSGRNLRDRGKRIRLKTSDFLKCAVSRVEKEAGQPMAYCRKSLANYKVPKRIEFSETELPKSGSGKILKRLLRDAAWARQERAVAQGGETR